MNGRQLAALALVGLAACKPVADSHGTVEVTRDGSPAVVMVSTSETLALPESACRAAPFDTFASPHVCEFHFEYPSASTKKKGCHLAIYHEGTASELPYLLGDVLWPMTGGFCHIEDAVDGHVAKGVTK